MYTFIKGDPLEYLLSYFRAFDMEMQQLGTLNGLQVVKCSPKCTTLPPPTIESVVDVEVTEERTHRRYAEALNSIILDSGLEILDVGGGDGHMAEWWVASGHKVSLLEVDAEQCAAARARLGPERVTLHDGRSLWPYAADSFDVCLLLFVLHHIDTEEAVLRTLSEAGRVARQIVVLEDTPHAADTHGLRREAFSQRPSPIQ
eukprot:6397072-Amphidinium_carterae.1